MEDFFDTILIFGTLAGFSYLVAQMSKEKDVGFWTLFATSMLFTPFVGLLIGLFAKRRRTQSDYTPKSTEESKNFLSKFMSKKDDKEELTMPDFNKKTDK